MSACALMSNVKSGGVRSSHSSPGAAGRERVVGGVDLDDRELVRVVDEPILGGPGIGRVEHARRGHGRIGPGGRADADGGVGDLQRLARRDGVRLAALVGDLRAGVVNVVTAMRISLGRIHDHACQESRSAKPRSVTSSKVSSSSGARSKPETIVDRVRRRHRACETGARADDGHRRRARAIVSLTSEVPTPWPMASGETASIRRPASPGLVGLRQGARRISERTSRCR